MHRRRIRSCLPAFACLFLLLSALLLPLQAFAAGTDTDTVRWQDYNGKRLGVLVGPLMEDAAKEYFPDSEHLLFDSYPDCVTALLNGKIDAFLGDEPGMKSLHAEQPAIDYIHDNITENNYSFAFRKNDPQSAALCRELNAFLKKCRKNGTMEELDDIWFGTDEAKKTVDMSELTGEKGMVRVVTTSTDMPFSYIKDGKNVGYDIDLVVRFCKDRGYALTLGDVDFAGRIPALQSGKYDFTTDMNVTPQQIFDNPKKELTRRFIRKLRVLTFEINGPDFDFIGAGAEMDRYCLQNDMAPKEKYRLRLAVEELVQQILLPRFGAPQMHILIEHADKEKTTDVTVTYAGERFDPRETENDLSLLVLQSAAQEVRYHYDPADAEPNRVEIRLKAD